MKYAESPPDLGDIVAERKDTRIKKQKTVVVIPSKDRADILE